MKKKVLALVLAASLALSAVACTKQDTTPDNPGNDDSVGVESNVPASPYTIQISGATSGGTMFLIANGLCQILNDEAPKWFSASAQSTASGTENIRLMEAGETDFGFGPASIAKYAVEGINAFEGETFENFRSVTFVYPQLAQIVVSDKSGIENFEDIRGNTICAGASGSAIELVTRDIFKGCGMTYDEASLEWTSESQSAELMKNNQADAANMTAPIGAAATVDLMSSGGYHLISLTDEQIDAICEVSDAYYKYVIPAGTYPNQDEDVQTIAMAVYLYCRADLEEDAVYQFVKCLYENQSKVEDIHSVCVGNFSLDNVTNGITVPLHPGAEKYYKEVGALK